MADDRALHRIVTKFMLDTCCYKDNSCDNSMIPLMYNWLAKSLYGCETIEVFGTGSTAEYYILPLIPCISDTDIMYCFNHSMAIEAGRTPPSELPAHYLQTVRVYEIDASNIPGYVYVRPSYSLRRKNGRYSVVNFPQSDPIPHYLPGMATMFSYGVPISFVDDMFSSAPNNGILHSGRQTTPNLGAVERHGPASQHTGSIKHLQKIGEFATKYMSSYASRTLSFDDVPCIHCVLWPLQAADWPTRHRMHGWPDSPIIQVVIGNGCDIVQAVHPLCKDDVWMNQHQWRLSFSRAEVTLLNSWTPLQQIIYHMLRFVIKKEIISKRSKKVPNLPNISGYHVKTLMLWACEEKPQSWWSAESSVITLCSTLIQHLADWVSDNHCPHYFIGTCNLLNHFMDKRACTSVCDDLVSVRDDVKLVRWFLDNYIRPGVQICPNEVKMVFDNIENNDRAYKALDNVFDWQRINISKSVISSESLMFIALRGLHFSFIRPQLKIILQCIEPYSQRMQSGFRALATLHVAYKASIHSLTDDLLEMLCQLFEVCTSDISNSATVIAEPQITGAMIKAIHLAKASTDCRNATDKIRHEMAKAFLHISLKSEVASNSHLVHILLGFLYFKTGHYNAASGHYTQLLDDCSTLDCSSRHIEAEYMTGINGNVDSMLGLIIFYQHVQNDTLDPGEHSSQAVQLWFTAELLAHYLHTRCSTLERNELGSRETTAYQRTIYSQHLIQHEQLLVSDILLYKLVERQLYIDEHSTFEVSTADDRECSESDMNASPMVFLLEQLALEKLVEFRQNGAIATTPLGLPITNEFEELYLYKCGLFEDCLQLCCNNICKYLQGTASLRPIWTGIPEILCLFEGNLVSLYGVLHLLHPSTPVFMRFVSNLSELSTISVIQSLYLMIECQKKLGCVYDSANDTLCLIQFLYQQNADVQGDFNLVSEFDLLLLKLMYRSLRLYIEAHAET